MFHLFLHQSNTSTFLVLLHYFMDDLLEHRSHMIQLFGWKTDGNLHCFILNTQTHTQTQKISINALYLKTFYGSGLIENGEVTPLGVCMYLDVYSQDFHHVQAEETVGQSLPLTDHPLIEAPWPSCPLALASIRQMHRCKHKHEDTMFSTPINKQLCVISKRLLIRSSYWFGTGGILPLESFITLCKTHENYEFKRIISSDLLFSNYKVK